MLQSTMRLILQSPLLIIFFTSLGIAKPAETAEEKISTWVQTNISGLDKKDQIQIYNVAKTLAEKTKKPVVIFIDFWASWCEPCKKSIPAYIDLQNDLIKKPAAKSLLLVFINEDENLQDAVDFIHQSSPATDKKSKSKDSVFSILLTSQHTDKSILSLHDTGQKIYKSIDFESIPFSMAYEIPYNTKDKSTSLPGKLIHQKTGYNAKSVSKLLELLIANPVTK
jgi:thiol-disulfide isomerase/thioredoxin